MDNLGFSGVVASVVAGIFLAASVWPSVVSVESMHNVWHFVEFCANTLLFLLAGMMFGELIYQSRLLKVAGLKDHTNADGVSYWRGMSGPAANSTFCNLRHAGGYNYAYNKTLNDAITYGKDVLHQTNSHANHSNLTWGVLKQWNKLAIDFPVPYFRGADNIGCALGTFDFGWAIVSFLFCLIIRGIVVIMLYPVLKWMHKLGYGAPVTWQSAVFMWWAGLRGAVGLALGIQFYRSDTGSFHLQSDAAQMLFHICFVALLTLVICAPTGEAVLRKLMLIGESKYEKAIRRDVEACIHDQAAVTLKKAFESVVQRVHRAIKVQIKSHIFEHVLVQKGWCPEKEAASLTVRQARRKVVEHLMMDNTVRNINVRKDAAGMTSESLALLAGIDVSEMASCPHHMRGVDDTHHTNRGERLQKTLVKSLSRHKTLDDVNALEHHPTFPAVMDAAQSMVISSIWAPPLSKTQLFKMLAADRGISVAAMAKQAADDPAILAQAKADADDGQMRAGDFTDNTYMKKAEDKYYRTKKAKEAAKNGGKGSKIYALHGGADEEDEHESDIGNIKNFILTWRDALMSRKVFETEDIRRFIAHICKTTDVPAAAAVSASSSTAGGTGGESKGAGGESKDTSETKDAAARAVAETASHHHHHHRQTGGFSQFDRECDEEESSSSCVDEDDDTDNESDDDDDGAEPSSGLEASHDLRGHSSTFCQQSNKCVRCAPNRFDPVVAATLQGVCMVCRKVEQVRGRFLALLKTQYKELIHEGYVDEHLYNIFSVAKYVH